MSNKGNDTPESAVERQETDRLLSLASRPELPAGAMDRLMNRIEPRSSPGVVPLAGRPPRLCRLLPPMAALPLAASLLLGVYLGAMGRLDGILPSLVTGDVAGAEDEFDDLGGVGEAQDYAEGEVS